MAQTLLFIDRTSDTLALHVMHIEFERCRSASQRGLSRFHKPAHTLVGLPPQYSDSSCTTLCIMPNWDDMLFYEPPGSLEHREGTLPPDSQAEDPESPSSPVAINPEPDSSLPNSSIDPSLAVISTNSMSRKRPLDPSLQIAAHWAQVKRLKPEYHQELNKASLCSEREFLLWLGASHLELRQSLDELHPPEAIWMMPKNLESKIDSFAIIIVLCPTLSAYVEKEVAVRLMMDLINRHPEWGFTAAAKKNKQAMDAVLLRVQSKLTERRYDVKKIIKRTLPAGDDTAEPAVQKNQSSADILSLCQALVKIYKGDELKVTVPMCGRVAFLRTVLSENPEDSRYWYRVDAELALLRTKYSGDPHSLSKIVKANLDLDIEKYGSISTGTLDRLSAVTVAEVQRETDQAATQTSTSVSDAAAVPLRVNNN
ncbi:hypothetical protein EVG20_g8109 [Dentipellis fragilis]|uniref:Uncharacterized protein n=1 Tax=Dentipellis fragilis TaxID=205917 RepID=A0A4Y9Y7P9_9AGAM|nr:hypothetical protein EVG20_g8109 [Dentipellis fragilis]